MFYCTLNQPEVSDPDIIGEVIIVTTDNITPPNDNCIQLEHQEFTAEVKLEEEIVKENSETKIDAAVTPAGNSLVDCTSDADVHSAEFLDKLREDREALTPSAIADRLKRHEESAFCSESDDLPKIDFKRQKPAKSARPRMQMFRALNSGKKPSISRSTSSPSKICITKVISLTEDADRHQRKHYDRLKKENTKSKEKNCSKHCQLDTVQISSAKEDEIKKDEPRFVNSFLLENEKDLARPLKKLISDITLNKKSEDPGVIEWGLVPRKAMHLAKVRCILIFCASIANVSYFVQQRIQKQLCGGEKDDEFLLSPRDRRLSLRSNVVMTPSGDCTDTEVKKQEKKRFASKVSFSKLIVSFELE